MNINEFADLILGLHDTFAQQVQSGSGWEIAAQNSICRAIQDRELAIAREVSYPDSNQSADFVFTENARTYVVELKVESATNRQSYAGRNLNTAYANDSNKLATFDMDAFLGNGNDLMAGAKWVVFLAYSRAAKQDIRNSHHFDLTQEQGGFMVGITAV